LCNESGTAIQLSEQLCLLNRERQKIESELFLQAMDQVEEQFGQPVLVLAGENWHPGVVGIVASRMLDKLSKPVFLISLENGIGKGSSRCLKGFNLVDALTDNAQLLLNYGGHDSAAGFIIEEKNIAALTDGLRKYAETAAIPETDVLTVDLRLTPEEVTLENAVMLQDAEPFGYGNAQPLFCMDGMTVISVQETADSRHTRLQLRRAGIIYKAIWFGKRLSEVDEFQNGIVDVAFFLDVNRFRETDSLQLIVSDMRLDIESTAYERLTQGLPLDRESRRTLAVDRDDIARVWRTAEKFPVNGMTVTAVREQAALTPSARLYVALDILQQLKLLRWHLCGYNIHIEIIHRGKTDLCRSAYWNTLAREEEHVNAK
jgi:single-stranded-DNA-specific exonuclease